MTLIIWNRQWAKPDSKREIQIKKLLQRSLRILYVLLRAMCSLGSIINILFVLRRTMVTNSCGQKKSNFTFKKEMD
jgi:hypothetical protein